MNQELHAWATQFNATLARSNQRIVFAESCTCGMAAAAMGSVPGVSQYFCGSFVVYRSASKQNWLGVSPQLISEFSTESPECSNAIASAALKNTPEASLAIAITGDLGPGVAALKDGMVYISIAKRLLEPSMDSEFEVETMTAKLTTENRSQRQVEAAIRLLQFGCQFVDNQDSLDPN